MMKRIAYRKNTRVYSELHGIAGSIFSTAMAQSGGISAAALRYKIWERLHLRVPFESHRKQKTAEAVYLRKI
ncbi:hypothetical protein [Caproicibacter fermentans]|uniref:hypothetical protein n=1 Tax=Caproicibacter fermentans TaxID=2576756 RepID=UPI0012EDC11A|nr:hypothetical protein [Caproicibacter fermentans]